MGAVSDKLEIVKKLITADNFMAQFIVCGLAEDKRAPASLFQLLIVGKKNLNKCSRNFSPSLWLVGLALIYSGVYCSWERQDKMLNDLRY